ncbi:MAG TPA: hypothetical protein IGS17_10475 [Oscillatoriales cyanobacterium M59_W2019_021]|nr:hypothetical protein [Oscillatoriales cyanobacterium M4454_W2019_049]HIK51330.1 hypothetical protein [Oscillatoriales cyanobacterium M59_W2019_021]
MSHHGGGFPKMRVRVTEDRSPFLGSNNVNSFGLRVTRHRSPSIYP